ncbi:hypothetical protein JAAARDRAFT_249559 [Jaapia argillacea MUCL 33604]|uniref:Uncharacterized protein n=1 Tax=Jaapia argillacea MUCL 33604 TaxID=933084 RepID=A0A067QG49_9AGAM|nr:hypothetical protein JAAARDRAFT_249559 [Jaapia argillacea MUCL 33604]
MMSIPSFPPRTTLSILANSDEATAGGTVAAERRRQFIIDNCYSIESLPDRISVQAFNPDDTPGRTVFRFKFPQIRVPNGLVMPLEVLIHFLDQKLPTLQPHEVVFLVALKAAMMEEKNRKKGIEPPADKAQYDSYRDALWHQEIVKICVDLDELDTHRLALEARGATLDFKGDLYDDLVALQEDVRHTLDEYIKCVMQDDITYPPSRDSPERKPELTISQIVVTQERQIRNTFAKQYWKNQVQADANDHNTVTPSPSQTISVDHMLPCDSPPISLGYHADNVACVSYHDVVDTPHQSGSICSTSTMITSSSWPVTILPPPSPLAPSLNEPDDSWLRTLGHTPHANIHATPTGVPLEEDLYSCPSCSSLPSASTIKDREDQQLRADHPNTVLMNNIAHRFGIGLTNGSSNEEVSSSWFDVDGSSSCGDPIVLDGDISIQGSTTYDFITASEANSRSSPCADSSVLTEPSTTDSMGLSHGVNLQCSTTCIGRKAGSEVKREVKSIVPDTSR